MPKLFAFGFVPKQDFLMNELFRERFGFSNYHFTGDNPMPVQQDSWHMVSNIEKPQNFKKY